MLWHGVLFWDCFSLNTFSLYLLLHGALSLTFFDGEEILPPRLQSEHCATFLNSILTF